MVLDETLEAFDKHGLNLYTMYLNINLDNPDPQCDLDYVPHHARQMKINTALSNSFGFGGTNGTLIFKKYGG